MERFSILFLGLCSLTILAESTSASSSITAETSKDHANDTDIENYYADDLLKSKNVQNNSTYFLTNEKHVKNVAEVKEHPVENLSYLNKPSNGSTFPDVELSSSYVKNTQHLEHIGDREGDASRLDHKEGPTEGLSSHDIVLDPILIPTRPIRQADKSDAGYSNPASFWNTYGDVKRGYIDSSQRNSNHESDLGVAEDRYPPQYPYWYRGQFANQRYLANDRRGPYRNYLRYPVFPGR